MPTSEDIAVAEREIREARWQVGRAWRAYLNGIDIRPMPLDRARDLADAASILAGWAGRLVKAIDRADANHGG